MQQSRVDARRKSRTRPEELNVPKGPFAQVAHALASVCPWDTTQFDTSQFASKRAFCDGDDAELEVRYPVNDVHGLLIEWH